MKEYDEDQVLTEYICVHYHQLMSREEQLAERAHEMRLKASGYGASIVSERLRKIARLIASDARIKPLTEMSREHFRMTVRDRLLREHADEITLNRCPECNRIPRSPEARQCPWCFYQWHDKPT